MTETEYEAFRASVEDTFTSLYVIDFKSLMPEQRKQHQEALGTAYLAVIRIENKQFADLTDKAIEMLGPLSASTLELQRQLAGLKKATEKLQLVSSALNVLTSIAKFLK